ncbi:MAG TPA: DNA methyltransferase [Bryobacteraceae bacterium]|jgi:site-specific DNA-methyltransferase (adenine-specific)|nr:DNA methyltransferase [Bryobacteraceae bacterium]
MSTTSILHHGDCIEFMAAMPPRSVDFILTDPPYIAGFKARDGRTVQNDDNDAWLKPAYAEMFRVLKQNAFAVSFYGWPKVDLFFDAWKSAGFHIGGHFVFRKHYTSQSAFLKCQHEHAALLIKGTPAFPAKPLPDVIDMPYSGNKMHPTQKPLAILKPLIQCFSEQGDTVLDPFAGSGSTLVAARAVQRHGIGIELDEAHHRTATGRLAEGLSARRAAGRPFRNEWQMACPACKGDDRIDIAVASWAGLFVDGMDVTADRGRTPESIAKCGACGHIATVRAFQVDGEAP